MEDDKKFKQGRYGWKTEWNYDCYGREAKTDGEKASEFIKQYASVNSVVLNKDDKEKRKKWVCEEYKWVW